MSDTINKIYIGARCTGKTLQQSLLLKRLVGLALQRNRSITIGTENIDLRYQELREWFPDAVIVIQQNALVIKGKFNGKAR